MVIDLRMFLDQLNVCGELKRISGADLRFEIGSITELSFENHGPALLFDRIEGYPPDSRIAVNLCSTKRRSLMALGMEPNLSVDEFMSIWQKRRDNYKPIGPKIVNDSPLLANVQVGEKVNLQQFPVPIWHELDGGPYIGTGVAVIQKDPDSGRVNVGTYRCQLHDRYTTGILAGTGKDGWKIMRKYWAKGSACPVAASFGPEPIIFATASGHAGCPAEVPEYEHAGALCGEPIPVIQGNVTGLPISAHSEIAIEGEIPPPEVESRTEGPFGEWTGYYMATALPEPVIKVKALYYRTDPILFGAPPFKPVRGIYSFSLPMRATSGLLSRLQKQGLPVRRAANFASLGAAVITVNQGSEDDVERIIRALDKIDMPGRLIFLVDDDVDPEDPLEVLWAVGTRFDPTSGVRVSVTHSNWFFNHLRTMEERAQQQAIPHKRLIISGCRPFHRLKDFPPVNVFSDKCREEVWGKWKMADWISAETARQKT